jgi:hypothetical protein
VKKAVLIMLALLGAAQAQAQDATDVRIIRESDIQLSPVQQEELKKWTSDVLKYRDWHDRYRNRIARNANGIITNRRERPPVLEWLPAKCDILADFVPRPTGELSQGCNLLSYYESNFTVDPMQQQLLQAQKQNEEDPHSSFWKHVHLDAGWSSMDYRMHTYGLVGVHMTLPELAKRVQVFLPPGFMLVSLPDGRGGREFQPAATIGVSIKLFRFDFPQKRAGTAYFNLAKAYVINRVGPESSKPQVDLVGLSFSWGR